MNDIKVKDEPEYIHANDIGREIFKFEEISANLSANGMIKTEMEEKKYEGEENDTDINCGHLNNYDNGCENVDFKAVIGSYPTLTSEKFINRKVEEDEEEEKIDIKYESLDHGLRRSAIENANELAEKQFECHNCCYKSKYKHSLTRHIMIIHEKEEMPRHACQLCSYKTFHASYLNRHIKNKHAKKRKQFECHKCSYKSREKYNLRKHILLYHQKEPAPQHACDICSYRSIYKSNLKRHIMRKHTEFGLECTLCGKSFKLKQSLDSHYVSMHRDQNDSFQHLLTHKVSQCSKCFYVTGEVARFKRHLLTHQQDQNKFKFECYTCGYKCVQKSHLEIHVRLHTSQLPFSCIECNQKFNQKLQLDGHIVSRHKENEELMRTVTSKIYQEGQIKFKFECYTCGYKCMQKSSLKTHVRLHTGQLPFSCRECNRRFNEKHHLDGHIVSRHKENEELMKTVTSKINQCLKCSYKTVVSSNLKKHIKICCVTINK